VRLATADHLERHGAVGGHDDAGVSHGRLPGELADRVVLPMPADEEPADLVADEPGVPRDVGVREGRFLGEGPVDALSHAVGAAQRLHDRSPGVRVQGRLLTSDR